MISVLYVALFSLFIELHYESVVYFTCMLTYIYTSQLVHKIVNYVCKWLYISKVDEYYFVIEILYV